MGMTFPLSYSVHSVREAALVGWTYSQHLELPKTGNALRRVCACLANGREDFVACESQDLRQERVMAAAEILFDSGHPCKSYREGSRGSSSRG